MLRLTCLCVLRWCLNAIVLAGVTVVATTPLCHAQLTVQSNPALSSPMPPTQPYGAPALPVLPVVTLNLETPPSTAYPVGQLQVGTGHHTQGWVIDKTINTVLNSAVQPGDTTQVMPLLNTDALEAALEEANRFNHFRVSAIVSDGAQTDAQTAADVRFEVTEPQPWQLTTAVDNQGRPGVGLYRSHVQLSHANVLGLGDSLLARYTVAARTHRIMGTYDVPVNDHGGRFNVSYRFQRHNYKPALTAAGNALVGRDHVWFVTLSQPVGKQRHWTPFVSTLFRRLSFNNRNVGIVNGDSWTAGLKWQQVDRYGRTSVKAQTTWSNGFFGANAKFWKAQAAAKRIVQLPHRQQLMFRGSVLLSPDPMPPALQLGVGGAYTVRGFSEGLFNADRGYTVSGEYRFPIPGLGYLSSGLHQRIRGVAFVDVGQAWIDKSGRNFIPGVSNAAGQTLLYSAGLGVRGRLSRFAQCFCDVAVANLAMGNRGGAELLGAPTVRAHFGVRTDWLPTTPKKQSLPQPGRLIRRH